LLKCTLFMLLLI